MGLLVHAGALVLDGAGKAQTGAANWKKIACYCA